jgi:hypothetical protein
MEANTFIKSVEVEGNKIKDIKFYGDWEISTAGGEGPTVTKYVFADGALVEDEAAKDDPFISLSVGTSGTSIIATINFMTDAYMVGVRGNKNAFATQYELFAGTNGVKIPAGESKSLTIYHANVPSDIKHISIILITEKALVKTYKFSTDYLRSLL